MNRRSLLNRIATLIGVGVTAPISAPISAMPAPKPGRSLVELQRSPVAGFQYHAGESVWQDMQVGSSLRLVREPENPYDDRAVRVDWRGRKLGYVPRDENVAVSHLLDAGRVLRAEISTLRESNNPWDRVELVITLAE